MAAKKKIEKTEADTITQEDSKTSKDVKLRYNTWIPKGLIYLRKVDKLLFTPEYDPSEAVLGVSTNKRYVITNAFGQVCYNAAETSSTTNRFCCGAKRAYEMIFIDNYAKPVIKVERALRCLGKLIPGCLQSVEVFAPPGVLCGYVKQEYTFFWPLFSIRNKDGDIMLYIEGPPFMCGLFREVSFQILTDDKTKIIGKIFKKFQGLRGITASKDIFGITFPEKMNISVKATLLGAVSLIDFMYFTSSQAESETDAFG